MLPSFRYIAEQATDGIDALRICRPATGVPSFHLAMPRKPGWPLSHFFADQKDKLTLLLPPFMAGFKILQKNVREEVSTNFASKTFVSNL